MIIFREWNQLQLKEKESVVIRELFPRKLSCSWILERERNGDDDCCKKMRVLSMAMTESSRWWWFSLSLFVVEKVCLQKSWGELELKCVLWFCYEDEVSGELRESGEKKRIWKLRKKYEIVDPFCERFMVFYMCFMFIMVWSAIANPFPFEFNAQDFHLCSNFFLLSCIRTFVLPIGVKCW